MALFPKTERWRKDEILARETSQYELFKQHTFEKWNNTPDSEFRPFYTHKADYDTFLSSPRKIQFPVILRRNPHLALYEGACDRVLVPDPFFDSYKEVPIDDWGFNILAVLETAISFEELLKWLRSSVSDPEIEKKRKLFNDIILVRLRYLFENKLIVIEP
ncbi:MAG: hypothetical protein LIP01_09010 [Tannerellaceae bacterium]|nr:hypothetical protein [Tannerellaceae bacterium]